MPDRYNWKEAYFRRINARNSIRNIRAVQNEAFVRSLEFNVPQTDPRYSEAFKLLPGPLALHFSLLMYFRRIHCRSSHASWKGI